MKSIISIPLNEKAKISVEEGQAVDNKTVIYETQGISEDRVLPISEILRVSPHKISKLLKKQPGSQVFQGELLAEKKSFVSQVSVRSPLNGIIKEIDLKKGFLIIRPKSSEEYQKISIPVKGIIKKIGKNSIEIEIRGELMTAVKGEGENAFGNLLNLTKSRTGSIDFDLEVEDKIVMLPEINSASCAKLEVLGSPGAIVKKCEGQCDFTFLEVEDETFNRLSKLEGHLSWIRPKEKEIIVMEE